MNFLKHTRISYLQKRKGMRKKRNNFLAKMSISNDTTMFAENRERKKVSILMTKLRKIISKNKPKKKKRKKTFVKYHQKL